MIDLSRDSEFANRLDFHLYQDSLYLIAFLAAGVLGMVVARFLWPADEEKCREIERENRRLESDWSALDEAGAVFPLSNQQR